MSVPTTFDERSGNSTSSESPKKTPEPTDVRPTMKPPPSPISTAAMRSRRVRMNGPSGASRKCMRFFATSPAAPITSATPSTRAWADCAPSP